MQLGRLERRVTLNGDNFSHEQRRLGQIVDVKLVGRDVDRVLGVPPEYRARRRRLAGLLSRDEVRLHIADEGRLACVAAHRHRGALHPAVRHAQVHRILGNDPVLLGVDHGPRHPRLHAVRGIDLDAVVELELALGIVEQTVLGLELGGDVVGLQQVAVDVDQLDRRLLVELDDGFLGPHLVTAAILGQPEVRRILHRQIICRDLHLPDLETTRSHLPAHAQRQGIQSCNANSRHRQSNTQ